MSSDLEVNVRSWCHVMRLRCLYFVVADEHEPEPYQYEGSDNEDEVAEGEPRSEKQNQILTNKFKSSTQFKIKEIFSCKIETLYFKTLVLTKLVWYLLSSRKAVYISEIDHWFWESGQKHSLDKSAGFYRSVTDSWILSFLAVLCHCREKFWRGFKMLFLIAFHKYLDL